MGARLVDFSPLRDERLPDDADVVLFGCGHPERYTAELVQNHCMKLALRGFVRGGGRVYGEGGGLAYLCQELETLDGARCRMAGVFPAVARRCRPGAPPVPAELTLDQPTWLGPAGTTLRGYRNGSWWLEPAGPLAGCAAQPSRQLDVVGNYRALGSRLHLNFAAFPHLLRNFFQTRLPEPRVTDPWALV
jgi:cobyrinic acid a,c-diamide synthase